jgi:hypothetical protein
MDEGEPRRPNPATATSATDPFERAKRSFVGACALIAGGLAIAGSVERVTGGVILLAGWLLAVSSLHRLGRTGSDRRA